MKRPNFERNRVRRQREASDRAQKRASRTPQQQLAQLDSLLGAGVGATKERKKLYDLIDTQTEERNSK